ncbi:MAG: serine O-acetyltransferase [Deltaproteobacteria bacterium]|nr:serine O-acetyltransferase [Deltaproteobacteria bacterium]
MSFWGRIREDVLVAFERDPAARSVMEVFLCYPGIHALLMHRVAHGLWRRGLRLTARLISTWSRFVTGIEIHPGAEFGRRCFIDHGMGVVVGETAQVGNDVLIYQGVSLGGTSLTKGKRHPTIEDYCVLGLGATVLGPITVGRHSRVGAGSVVVQSVPPHSTVVGVPGRVVNESPRDSATGAPLLSLEHGELPDPVVRTLNTMAEQIHRLEQQVAQLRGPGATDDGSAAATEDSGAPPAGK